MKKLYISGKISGLIFEDAVEKFERAENEWTSKGFDVVNPIKVLPYEPEYTWGDYMLADLTALKGCDAILMLPCWLDSKGACIERDFAIGCGIEVMYVETL